MPPLEAAWGPMQQAAATRGEADKPTDQSYVVPPRIEEGDVFAVMKRFLLSFGRPETCHRGANVDLLDGKHSTDFANLSTTFTDDNRLVRTDTVSSSSHVQQSAVVLDDSGNMSGIANLTVDGKLTVGGLIDPTGLEFTRVSANPGGTANNTLWQDDGGGGNAAGTLVWENHFRVFSNLTIGGLISASGDITFRPSGDTDDGLIFRTVSNAAYILPATSGGRMHIGNTQAEPSICIDMALNRGALLIPTSRTITDSLAGWYGMPSSTTVTMDILNGSVGGLTYADCTFAFNQSGSGSGAGNLFRNSATFKNVAGTSSSLGSQYTFVNTAQYEGDTDAISGLFIRNVLYQPTFIGTSGGTITYTTANALYSNPLVQAGATLTNHRDLEIAAGTVNGTITNRVGLYIADLNGTNAYGIQSAMTSGATKRFINHSGAAISVFAGDLHVTDGISFVLGTSGGNRVELLRSAAGVMRMIGVGGTNNEGLDWDFDDATANNIRLSSSTSAGLQVDLAEIAFGSSATGGSNNWFFNMAAAAKTTTVGGDFANCLNTTGGNHTIDSALTTFFQWTVNAPAGTIGTGSVTDAGNMLIQTSVSIGTNRYGLLITTNPSGGTLNYAFRQSNASALARFDGRLDINRGVALGAGAAATLGLIGGSGPTAAAQAQWLEIDIGGVAHWIAVWT